MILEAVVLRFIRCLVEEVWVQRSHDIDEELTWHHARVLHVDVREVDHHHWLVFNVAQQPLDGELCVFLNLTPVDSVIVEIPFLSRKQLLHELVTAEVLSRQIDLGLVA